MAAGLPLPTKIITHGHWLVNNKKMSKSDGSGICPLQLIDLFDVDPVRYFLIRDGRIQHDSEYSFDLVNKRYQELASQLGNLLLRCTSKSFIPKGSLKLPSREKALVFNNYSQAELLKDLDLLPEAVSKHYESGNISAGLDLVMTYIHALNQYWGSSCPWKFSADKKLEVATLTLESLRICGILLYPIIPKKANEMLDIIGIPATIRNWRYIQVGDANGTQVFISKNILFPALNK